MTTVITTVTDITVALAALGFGVFCVRYFYGSDWRSTEVGRNAMALMVVCWATLSLFLVRIAWRLILGSSAQGPVWDVLRLCCFLLVNWVVWWRVWLLWKLQRDNRKPPDPSGRDQ